MRKGIVVSNARTRAEIRLAGHWRRVRLTVLIVFALLLVQWPMRQGVLGGDPTWTTRLGAGGDVPACLVPARLSLLVDALLICAYVMAAWRTRCYVALKAGTARVPAVLGLVGAGLVSAAAVLDVVENLLLWRRFAAPTGILPGRCPALEVATLSPVMWALWTLGVVVLVVALLTTVERWWRRPPTDADDGAAAGDRTADDGVADGGLADGGPADDGTDEDRHDKDGQIICCSGGGIRSAAFSLGALQLLTAKGMYQKASTVIGVSGGGYIAAAFHILRQSLTGREGEKPPYALGTPELARLRRRTHYLMPSVSVGVRGIMSLLYGAVVNLVLIGVALRCVSWVLGWTFAEVGIIRGLGTRSASVEFGTLPLWYWLGALGALALVVLLFVAEVVVDRFRVPPGWLRTEGRDLAQLLTVPGFVLAGLLLGVPLVLVWVHNVGQGQLATEPGWGTGLGNGLVSAASNVAGPGAAGADPLLDSQFGFATLAALGAAFLGLARSAWKGLESFDGGGSGRAGFATAGPDGAVAAYAPSAPSLRTKLLAWLRTKFVPWLGSALLVAAGLVVLLRWTAGYVSSEEWRSRWWVAAVCAGLVLLIGIFADATRTSLHPYYRERLATAYLARRTSDDTADEYDYAMPMPYSTWGVAHDGGPQLVIVASANAFDPEFIPPDRGCVPFVFDPALTGVAGDAFLPAEGLEPSAAYEIRADYHQRDVTVPGAIAISGAAFAPLTGRENARTRPMRLLFAVVNARLGVWLPNPYWGTASRSAAFARRCAERSARRQDRRGRSLLERAAGVWAHLASVADKPGAYRLFKEAVGRTSLYDRRLYVTDGGHYDNLGLVEALRRRPRRIIVIDASNDPEDTFAAVGSAIATARIDLGVHVDLDPRRLQRGDGPRIERGWARGSARYPDGTTTEILLVKAVLAGEQSWDVESYAVAHGDFPRRTTGDQLYGEFDFEAYRALGYSLTKDMCDYLAARGLLESGSTESTTDERPPATAGATRDPATDPAVV